MAARTVEVPTSPSMAARSRLLPASFQVALVLVSAAVRTLAAASSPCTVATFMPRVAIMLLVLVAVRTAQAAPSPSTVVR